MNKKKFIEQSGVAFLLMEAGGIIFAALKLLGVLEAPWHVALSPLWLAGVSNFMVVIGLAACDIVKERKMRLFEPKKKDGFRADVHIVDEVRERITSDKLYQQVKCATVERNSRPRVIYTGFSPHDDCCYYRCPCCGKTFDDWTLFGQKVNENGDVNDGPHCKTEPKEE